MIYLYEELAPVLDQENLFGAQRGYSSVPEQDAPSGAQRGYGSVPEQEVPVGVQRGLNPVPTQIDVSIGAQRRRSPVSEQGDVGVAQRELNPVSEQIDPVNAQRSSSPVSEQYEASSNTDLTSPGGNNSFVVGDFSDDILTYGISDEAVTFSAVDDGIDMNYGFASGDDAMSIYSIDYVGGFAIITDDTPCHFLFGLVDPNSLVLGVSIPYSAGMG